MMNAAKIFWDLHLYVVIAILTLIVGGALPVRADVKTVPYVDLQKYLGDWYEIGSIPQSFSKDCFCTRARYSLQADGDIEVYNTCNRGAVDGPLKEANGQASVADKNTNAKLDVTFFWPFKGDYWIIGLDPDYRYAVISNEQGSTLWVLSREPSLSDKDFQETLRVAAQNGIDTGKLKTTEQRACVYP